MNDFVKLLIGGAIAGAGYLVGFYECKVKTQDALLKVLSEKEKEEKED